MQKQQMKIRTEKVAIYQSSIHCYIFGDGALPLFCFHGYGNNGRSFEFLAEFLGDRYTLFAIDLPFHGLSSWNEKFPFKPEDLINIIDRLVSKYGFKEKKLAFCGYSLGGRIALALTEMMASRTEKTALIAPDGLHINFWYWLGTQTAAGRLLFYSLMHKPRMLHRFFNFARKSGMANSNIIDFAGYYVKNEQARMNLYNRWTFLSKFKPSVERLRKAIVKHHISLRMLFGNDDAIILSKRGEKMKKDIPFIKVKTISANHFLLNRRYANEIVELFT